MFADIYYGNDSRTAVFCNVSDPNCKGNESFRLNEGETKKIGDRCLTVNEAVTAYTFAASYLNASVYDC